MANFGQAQGLLFRPHGQKHGRAVGAQKAHQRPAGDPSRDAEAPLQKLKRVRERQEDQAQRS
jgi:hypothetical protein